MPFLLTSLENQFIYVFKIVLFRFDDLESLKDLANLH